ncbi:MAG: DegV family protein [Promicromonosporaceae bacterium]|nr:DegV family protein [Promicromonosporaceae bacterium]
MRFLTRLSERLRHRGQAEATLPVVPPQLTVRVVTDSTASLPSDVAERLGIVVVPLRVITDDGELREGVDETVEQIGDRLSAGQRLTTSQPPPEVFATVYQQLLDDGATEVLSIHLSGELSGTCAAAESAAARANLPVTVVDSGMAAATLGFAVMAAAECATTGATAEQVAARAREVAASGAVLFLVDSLEYLRRGGRLSAGSAALGAALGVRPILEIAEGRVQLVRRVRTRKAALDKLVSLAVGHTKGMSRAAVAVHHVEATDRAVEAAARLEHLLDIPVAVAPAGAVLSVHTGPGSLAICAADVGNHSH